MSRRRPPAIRAAVLAAVVAAAAGLSSHGPVSSQAAPTTAPTVTVKVGTESFCSCLRGPAIPLSATATPSAGRTIASVEFQYSPAGANEWTTIATDTTAPFTAGFDTTAVADPHPAQGDGTGYGLFDVRTVATDSAGESQTAVARDNVIANFPATVVTLADPGTFVSGKSVVLSATVVAGGSNAHRATFQYSPAGAEQWTEIPAVPAAGPGTFKTRWDTSALPDGPYDLRVVASDDEPPPEGEPPVPSDPFVSGPRRERRVDNTAPTSTVTVPAGPLSGEVTVSAAADDAGSGVGGVRFQRSVAGAGSWRALPGACAAVPCTRSFDTRLLDDGRYDFRVVASDTLGNSAASPVVGNVEISNPGRVSPDRLAVENVVAPAHDLRMLGTVAGSPQHEAWAIGVSSARPAVGLDGTRLSYAAPGNQVVLLRYTDAGGWQIADVLRNDDGTPFDQVSGATVKGQMLPSGEAWVALSQRRDQQAIEVALFHRAPSGRFLRDPAATDAGRPNSLSTVLSNGMDRVTMRLDQDSGGRAYGVLVAPANPSADFGLLTDGTWSKRTASLPPGYLGNADDRVVVAAADAGGPGKGWAALNISRAGAVISGPLILARFDGDTWTPLTKTGLDALDLTGRFANRSLVVKATAIRADGDSVWIDAFVGDGRVVARYDAQAGDVTRSWCADLNPASLGCAAPLDADHPAAVPEAIFDTPGGKIALALAPPGNSRGFVHVFANGDWTRIAAPGFSQTGGAATFSTPTDGWLAGADGLGRLTAKPTPDPLARWPQANRSTLTSVALPPGDAAGVEVAGALAVGLDGTVLRYDADAGWLIDPVPSRAQRLALRSVAYAGPSSAFAVGQAGVILHWDGTSWTEDPQSVSLTQNELTAVAFAPDGEGWAVGRFGTILHFDGHSWSREQPPNATAGTNLTSVTVAGSDPFAVDDGNLIRRDAGGHWLAVPQSALPADLADDAHDLRLVDGLPDGGVVAAGRSTVIVRQRGSGRFENSDQPLEGIVVALAAFRDPRGTVRTFASLAPPLSVGGRDVDPGFPAGDGNLLRETSDGWDDLSRGQFPNRLAVPGDGVVKPDPVLAIASDPTGAHAWAVGGYAGTATAAGIGTQQILPARANGWRTAQIWRYDSGGSTPSPALQPAIDSLPAKPGTVSFAFFSNVQCRVMCAATRDAQPDVNLNAATKQIAAFGAQPGGPAFAVLGGNAVGPIDDGARNAGNGAFDFARLPAVLSPLGGLPLFAAHGPRDDVATGDPRLGPWADAFARSPAPFGPAQPPGEIAPAGAGAEIGAVHRYYAFDASQNGGRVRVIVLDNAAGPLELAAPGQTAWLRDRLDGAAAEGLPVVVILGRALGSSPEDLDLGNLLSDAGVVAVFAGSDVNEKTSLGDASIPQYAGGTLGYQSSQNNGVAWYFVSINTAARKASVSAIPVVDSLALKPLLGVTAARSSTLAFEAVGRRPQGSLATRTSDDPAKVEGYDNYVGIPAPDCARPPCQGVAPTYSFTSSDPTIGDFVVPSGPRSRFPKLDASGKPIPSSTSGLFCAYNSGSATVSVTTGLLRASLPVTVLPGGFGRPCGTVFRAGVGNIVRIQRSSQSTQTAGSPSAAPPPTPATAPSSTPAVLPKITLPAAPQQQPVTVKPPARPAAPSVSPPVPVQEPPPVPVVLAIPQTPIIAVPPIPVAGQPVPPGGSSTAQAAARKKEKARKHASQSASFTVRPSTVSGEDWFYPSVGGASVLALLLVAAGVHPGPRRRPRPALLTSDDPGAPPPPQEGWRW